MTTPDDSPQAQVYRLLCEADSLFDDNEFAAAAAAYKRALNDYSSAISVNAIRQDIIWDAALSDLLSGDLEDSRRHFEYGGFGKADFDEAGLIGLYDLVFPDTTSADTTGPGGAE